jgi:hypothetical protein
MSPEAWADLAEIIVGYRTFEYRRTPYPIAAERKRWQRIDDLTTKLAAELRLLRRQMPWPADPGAEPHPLWFKRGLAALWEIKNEVEIRAGYHAIWRAHRARQNPHREFLYGGVLRVWTDRLGGELKYSISAGGKPGGPLVRFFLACVEPVLAAETPRTGIADIIDRERKARLWTENQKENQKKKLDGV